jgi:hypothetical protein
MKGIITLALKQTDKVSKIAGRLETAIHDVYMYIFG